MWARPCSHGRATPGGVWGLGHDVSYSCSFAMPPSSARSLPHRLVRAEPSSTATATATVAVAHCPAIHALHLHQLGRYRLPGILEDLDQLPGHPAVLGAEKGVGLSGGTRSARSADAVHVVLHRLREVVVHHDLNVPDVQPSRSHICGHEDPVRVASEVSQHAVPLHLLLVPVDSKHRKPRAAQGVDKGIAAPLCLGEDQGLAAANDGAEELHHPHRFLEVLAEVDDLGHVAVRRKLGRAHVHVNRVAQEVRGQLPHLPWPRGTPHQRLAVCADLADNLADLGLKPHVQHTVGLIQHEVCHPEQVGGSAVQHVDHPAGGANHNVAPPLQVAHLSVLRGPSVEAGAEDVATPELPALPLDLHCELAGGRNHQGQGTVPRLQGSLSSNVNEGRQSKRQCLPRARHGDADEVAALQRDGDGHGLDQRGRAELRAVDLVHDPPRETSLLETVDGVGDVAARPGDCRSGQPPLDLLLGPRCHLGLLLVEVLAARGELLGLPVHGPQVGPQPGHLVRAREPPAKPSTEAPEGPVASPIAAVGGVGGAAAVVPVAPVTPAVP
eukprot:RCo034394